MKLSFTRKKNLAEDEAPKRRAEDMASDLAAPTPKRRLSDQMPGTASAAGVMQFNGKSYAVGLLWFTVQEDSNKKLLAKRIEKTRADFTCLRQHISQQQGFGWLEKGHRRGMPAAAAMIADQLVGEWHGVFEAENGWWYVQVRSDTITPNGDRFFESEEDAFNIFQDEMQKNIWPHAYAPEKWHMADNNNIRELSLKNMLDDLATTTLTPTNITAMFGGETMRNAALGFIGLLMLVMAGFVLYSLFAPADIGPLPSTRTPEQIAATARIMTLNAPKGKAADAVSPRQLLKQCGTAAAGLYVSMPGWTPASFTCASGKAAMAWQQKKGSLSDAKAIGLKTWPPATAVALANRILTATTTLGSLPKVETAALPIQEQALLYLEQNLQPLGALQVKPVVPPAPPVPKARTSMLSAAPAPAPPPPRLPSYLDIQMSSGFSPDQMAPLLEQPGLELLKLDWNITSGVWQYKVKWTYDTPAPVAPAAPAKPGAAPANAAVPAVVPNAAASPAGPVTPQQPGIAGNTAAAARQLQPVNPAPISPSAPEGR